MDRLINIYSMVKTIHMMFLHLHKILVSCLDKHKWGRRGDTNYVYRYYGK